MSAEQCSESVEICDQLEKTIERPQVNEVWDQTVLKGISIPWIRTPCLPLGSVGASSSVSHTHTYGNRY